MPRIVFIRDVTLPEEPAGTGPHYRRGYSPEVSETLARKWINAGDAIEGHALPTQALEEATKQIPQAPKWGKRRRRRE